MPPHDRLLVGVWTKSISCCRASRRGACSLRRHGASLESRGHEPCGRDARLSHGHQLDDTLPPRDDEPPHARDAGLRWCDARRSSLSTLFAPLTNWAKVWPFDRGLKWPWEGERLGNSHQVPQ